jgi:lactate permease
MVAHAAAGWRAVRSLLAPVLILGIVMGGAQLLIASTRLWNIGAFCSGLTGLAVCIPLAQRHRGEQNHDNGSLDPRALGIALSGYAILVVIILCVSLIPSVSDFLGRVVIQVQFPEVRTSLGFVTPAGTGRKIALFRHAGACLLYTSLLAYLVYRRAGLYKPGAVHNILDGTLRRVMSSSVSIAAMVSMAVIMENAGMTDQLARGLAEGMGSLFPLASPWIGALGAFMTGSNTNSNVVFGALQLRTAELLAYSPAIILAAQTAGAALASVMAPTKVVVGASTAGMAGREGDVMRALFLYIAILVLLISALAMVGVWIIK